MQRLAGRPVPDLHRRVVTPGSDPPAVGAERHAQAPVSETLAVGELHPIVATAMLEGERVRDISQVPDSDPPIVARGSNVAAAGTRRHAPDPGRVIIDGEQRL